LTLKHARLARVEGPDGKRQTVVEYSFDKIELNRAAVNIDEAFSGGASVLELTEEAATEPPNTSIRSEAMLFFEQASRRPGKERGRTGDKGVVPDVSTKPLPVYFRKGVQDLKDQMIRGQANPLTNNTFIVDVYVYRDESGEPTAYYVTDVHRVVPLGS